MRDWMAVTTAELYFETGDWDAVRSHLDMAATHPGGRQLIFRRLCEAEVCLGVGDEESAARYLEEIEPLVARSSEPQFIGAFGALLAESRRRARDLVGARAAVGNALDRIELCTDDVMRIARVTAAGMRVEADIAQRARDLRERADERDALARARIHMQRLRAAAAEGGPVERAWFASGAADLARARGRTELKLWMKAAREWEEISRPFQRAVALWRATEAHIEAGDRGAAAGSAQGALEITDRLGARWLTEELIALAGRARLRSVTSARPRAESARPAGQAIRQPVGTGPVPVPTRIRLGSPPGSARCWRWSPRGQPIVRSARPCTWRRRPPASTSRGFSASWACGVVRKPRQWRTGCISAEPVRGGSGRCESLLDRHDAQEHVDDRGVELVARGRRQLGRGYRGTGPAVDRSVRMAFQESQQATSAPPVGSLRRQAVGISGSVPALVM